MDHPQCTLRLLCESLICEEHVGPNVCQDHVVHEVRVVLHKFVPLHCAYIIHNDRNWLIKHASQISPPSIHSYNFTLHPRPKFSLNLLQISFGPTDQLDIEPHPCQLDSKLLAQPSRSASYHCPFSFPQRLQLAFSISVDLVNVVCSCGALV